MLATLLQLQLQFQLHLSLSLQKLLLRVSKMITAIATVIAAVVAANAITIIAIIIATMIEAAVAVAVEAVMEVALRKRNPPLTPISTVDAVKQLAMIFISAESLLQSYERSKREMITETMMRIIDHLIVKNINLALSILILSPRMH